MLISDQHFDAFLKCRTKAHFTFSSARTREPSHPIVDWQGHIAEIYQKNCRDYLRSVSGTDCFVGTPRPEDLRNAKYPLIFQPLITAQDAESHIHALERRAVPTQKGRSAGLPGATEVANAKWVEVRNLQNQSDLLAAQQNYALGVGELSTILLQSARTTLGVTVGLLAGSRLPLTESLRPLQ